MFVLPMEYEDSSEDTSSPAGGKISPRSTPKIAELRKLASRPGGPLHTSRQLPRLPSGHLWLLVLLTIVIAVPAMAVLAVAVAALVRCLLCRHESPEGNEKRDLLLLELGRENWKERNDVCLSVVGGGGGPAESQDTVRDDTFECSPVLVMLSEASNSD